MSFKTKGNIIRVLDGDTVLVAVKVRLSNVNASELGTVEGEQAKKRLKNWQRLNDKVLIESNGVDLYGRILGRVRGDREEGEVYI